MLDSVSISTGHLLIAGTNFKRWRTECGLTQEQAAGKLGLSKARIEHYDKGISRSSNRPAIPSLAERTLMAVIASKITVQPWPE
jgi:transcriptional regulator with XRE-family HTH domain